MTGSTDNIGKEEGSQKKAGIAIPTKDIREDRHRLK